MAYMKEISFEQLSQLECMKNIGSYRRCRAASELRELMQDGCTAFEKRGCFQPAELYDDVMAACKELNFQISENIKEWSVAGGGSGETVFIAFTDAIKPYWAAYNLYKPVQF